MDEHPIRPDDFEPDWQKIVTIAMVLVAAVVGFLIATPCIILLWKAALRH